MKHQLVLVAIVLATLAAGLMYSCGQNEQSPEPTSSVFGRAHKAGFVGDQTCRSCHAEQMQQWKGSHHDYAMKVADSTSVRGDFGNVTFEQEDGTYRFYRKGDRYMVEAPGPDGNRKTYEITHTFGWTPLQQYLVDFGNGKLQVLNVAWNVEKGQWFSMHPDEKVRPGDWMHWTGGAMNWNTMCADCHSTQLEQNYVPRADSFHTTWSSINVSCESCHGPGKEHVEFMQSKASEDASIQRIREDLELTKGASQMQQINTCASCHSLREKLVDGSKPEKGFLDHFNPNLPHPDMYFSDGQIKQEDYVYASFLQSKMFQNGVKCNDCHDPHSLELKANVTDNSLCLQCHAPKYNAPDHYFHEAGTKASQCVSCHMPGRYYMEIDFRRDHSFRVPRPDLSAKFGTPNACNNCHDSKSAEWAAQKVEDWYGPERPKHFSEILAEADSMGAEAIPDLKRLVADTAEPAIARATAVWYLGQFPSRQSRGVLERSLQNSSPLIRKAAARAAGSLSKQQKKKILPMALDDSVRAVRVAAAEGLAGFGVADFVPSLKQSFKTAIREYRSYLDVNQYFPSGLMNRGQFFEKQGQTQQAIAAYQKALQKDPQLNPARLNLAYLYNGQGNKQKARQLLETVIEQEPSFGPAHFSLALLLAGQGQMPKAITHFKRAAELMPDHARVRYNLAISYQQSNRPADAEKRYLQAIKIAPDNPDYRYGICTFYLQQKKYAKALPHARKLTELQPQNRRFQRLLQRVQKRLGP